MKKQPFKIECTIEVIATIKTALMLELERNWDDNKTKELIEEAIKAVNEFTTNR